ncbi:histidine kinase [Caminicella sporogenes]|nr:histidine kinase [Caminicella sporogenes]
MLQLLQNLTSRSGIIIILAFLLSKNKTFKRLVTKKDLSLVDKISMSILFGVFGIIGTYSGIKIGVAPGSDAIANSRVIGVFVAGWLGGPFVGILSGIIAGLHRWVIDIGGFTSLACGLSTVVEGLIAGYSSRKFNNVKTDWIWALIMGAFSEIVQMMIILVIAKPFNQALSLVKIIWFPMIFVNSIGIAVFIGITQQIFLEKEQVAAEKAELILKIANKTLPHLRKGFNTETAKLTAQIIYDMTDIDAVAITDDEKILAHVGEGSDHHKSGSIPMTDLTYKVIKSGKYEVAKNKEEIGCKYEKCSLLSAVIFPLKERDKVIGTLKLYKSQKPGITSLDLKLAQGLAKLFSTQIELSKIDYQRKLLVQTELKILQAQINPHFLFNSLNTIASFIRTKPDKARQLIIHLGDYLRQNMTVNQDEIDIYKEIFHIKSYLAIVHARFGDKIKIDFDIEEGLKIKIPPLILQPIVENAVKHGLKNINDGIEIKIIAKDEGEYVKLSVIDNGVGIEKSILEKLFLETDNDSCIGLRNVDKRLKYKYGSAYGLEIKSELGKGTTINIKIPKLKANTKGGIV